MPEPFPVQVADTVLPEPAKVILGPLYRGFTRLYYLTTILTGRNYFEFEHGESEYRVYYTLETAVTYANLIYDETITTENVPLSVLNPDSEVDALIDIGSHYGIYSVLLKKINPDVPLYAFEPDNYNRNILTDVLAENGIEATVDHRVVSDETGDLTFYVDDADGSESHSIAAMDGFHEVEKEAVALPDFFDETGIQRPFLKIDAEGAELRILRNLFSDPPEYVEGIVEVHPDKLSGTVDEVITLLRENCSEVEFIADTSPTHPNTESIDHQYNRPMYKFEVAEDE